MDDPVTCSNNFPNCGGGVNQVRVVPASQCACMAVLNARAEASFKAHADERARICEAIHDGAMAVVSDPNMSAIDGFVAAGWLEMVDIIEDLP